MSMTQNEGYPFQPGEAPEPTELDPQVEELDPEPKTLEEKPKPKAKRSTKTDDK